MPLFEYRCDACENDFELLVRANEKPHCPECGTERIEKLLSTTAATTAGARAGLPITGACPPSDAPPCGPGCCRLP